MIAILKRQLFEATEFDSGSLGLVTSVIHQFAEPGIYRASVRQHDRQVADVSFEVREDAAAMQLDLDLAAKERRTERCRLGIGVTDQPAQGPYLALPIRRPGRDGHTA